MIQTHQSLRSLDRETRIQRANNLELQCIFFFFLFKNGETFLNIRAPFSSQSQEPSVPPVSRLSVHFWTKQFVNTLHLLQIVLTSSLQTEFQSFISETCAFQSISVYEKIKKKKDIQKLNIVTKYFLKPRSNLVTTVITV